MSNDLLRIVTPDSVDDAVREPVDQEAAAVAAKIVGDVRRRGEAAVLDYARLFGDLEPGAPIYLGRDDMEAAARRVPAADRELLERAASRIEAFAGAQRRAMEDVSVPIPGGRAGHTVCAIRRAGCYAPGGRFPLPSSVLMTAVTARAAGVGEVWVASPRPTDITLCAARIAGADGVLGVGGAQAIAALTFGLGPVPPCDAVVGPGNRYVTAAKQAVAGRVAIDMLAGPSELVVLADGSANPGIVAADLLAQAEHDPEAAPILVTADADLVWRVNASLDEQIRSLPTADIARAAFDNGFAVVVSSVEEGVEVCDRIAPEHLEVLVEDAEGVAENCSNYGGIFIGEGAAEVLGDYGAGPNHTLPTGGTARSFGGLSVYSFLRIRTWMAVDDPSASAPLLSDAERLAGIEGLEAHARAAAIRAR